MAEVVTLEKAFQREEAADGAEGADEPDGRGEEPKGLSFARRRVLEAGWRLGREDTRRREPGRAPSIEPKFAGLKEARRPRPEERRRWGGGDEARREKDDVYSVCVRTN